MGLEHATTVDVVRATAADIPTLSRTLAAAFEDDPVFAWVVRDAASRRAGLPATFIAFLELYLPHGETYQARNGAGAALWAPPATPLASEEGLERFGQRISDVLAGDAERAFELMALLDAHHPAEPSFHLQFIGVAPGHQGRGVGSRLLTGMLDRCDATGTPAYLEATSVHNRRLYARHGFEAMGEITLPDGPCLWPMWRNPAPRA